MNTGACAVLSLVLWAVVATPAGAQAVPVVAPFGPDVRAQMAEGVRLALRTAEEETEEPAAWDPVERFYLLREFQPAWLFGAGRDALRVFIDRARTAAADGLPASAYDPEGWQRRLNAVHASVDSALAADVALTSSVLRFAQDLAYGTGGAESSARSTDAVALLAGVSDRWSARSVLARLEPQHAEYRALRKALRRYSRIAGEGGWPAVPDEILLKLDDRTSPAGLPPANEATVVSLCRRLEIAEDLDPEDGCGFTDGVPAYNAALERAVRRFQSRHGLRADGIVGPNTVAALNVPVEARVAQLAVNLDRWRRLPDDLGRVAVVVNIAAFRLEAREDGNRVLSMAVVSGEPETPTPVFSDEISYLVFRPFWNVPRSIAEGELLPRIARNPGYLDAADLQIVDGWSDPADIVNPAAIDWSVPPARFPYRLRQRPGPANSLGLVKFMFPNRYNVYLHDTPADHRFEVPRRAFSHGCVRVEDPIALADFLLKEDPGWARDDIAAAMRDGERTVVPLETPVPVHLTYFTAWVEGGLTHFRFDVYGLDEPLRSSGVPSIPERP